MYKPELASGADCMCRLHEQDSVCHGLLEEIRNVRSMYADRTEKTGRRAGHEYGESEASRKGHNLRVCYRRRDRVHGIRVLHSLQRTFVEGRSNSSVR